MTDSERALFIADLHLCDARPELLQAFCRLCAGPATEVDSLYILGDLFEYWPGDEFAANPTVQTATASLKTLQQYDTAVYFIHGNRDFLLGSTYAEQAGITLLPDPYRLKLGNETLLLSHGDALCTDDHAYQQFRMQVRNPDWQTTFLAMPLDQRLALIDKIRVQSNQSKQNKTLAIMDVNNNAVAALLRAHHYPDLIHGHTHRPDHHIHTVDGHHCHRWVLPDWRNEQAPFLRWNGRTLQHQRYPDLSPKSLAPNTRLGHNG